MRFKCKCGKEYQNIRLFPLRCVCGKSSDPTENQFSASDLHNQQPLKEQDGSKHLQQSKNLSSKNTNDVTYDETTQYKENQTNSIELKMSHQSSPKKGMAEKVVMFGKAYLAWMKAGFPNREPEEQERIYLQVCTPCEYFKQGGCTICGCGLKMKIKMQTSHCPKEKW